VPRWWIRPSGPPSDQAGLHRFVWDLHWPPPAALETSYSIAAIPHDTPKEPRGPWALPGRYRVRLTAAGRTLERPLTVAMDPRVNTPLPALRQQLELSQKLAEALRQDTELVGQVRALRKEHPQDAELAALEGTADERPGVKEKSPALVPWNARIAAVYQLLQSTDAPPTPQTVQAAAKVLREADELFGRARKALSAQR
jgi:hypothetical protein